MTFGMRLNGGELMRDGEGVKHDGFTVTVMKDGTRFGNGEPLIKVLNTLMTQGSWQTISRFSNRSPTLIVKVEGETPDGLNDGEVWLSSLMHPGTLEWLPPDQKVWTVFDVVSAYIARSEDDGWDLDETKWIRRFHIPISAGPHPRSQFRTITPALPLASTPVLDELVTDGSSATGWTASWKSDYGINFGGSITPEVVSGAVRIEHPGSQAGALTLQATRTLEAVPSDTPFIRADLRLYGPVDLRPPAIASNGSTTTTLLPAEMASDGDGGVTVYYRVPTGTTSLTLRAYVTENDDYFARDTAYLEVDQVRRVSRLPDTGTNREKAAVIMPGGSAPAEGSLHVSHPTAGLGKVMIFTYPLGRPSPSLMQHRYASATPEEDDDAINGQWISLQSSPLVLHIPDSQLPTRGLAAMWARLWVDASPATVRCLVNTQVPPKIVGQTQTHEVVVGTGQLLVPLGLFTIPGATTGPAGVTVVNLSRLSGGNVWVDGVWAAGQDEESALTIVDAGTGAPTSGGPSNHLWINAPTVDKPAGEVLIGTSLADARWPNTIQAGPEVHRFGREGVAALTVTCGAPDASTDFGHYMRWTHHAAKAGGEDS